MNPTQSMVILSMVRWVDSHVWMGMCVVSENEVGKHCNHGHTYEPSPTCPASRLAWLVHRRCGLLLGAETRDEHCEQRLVLEIVGQQGVDG